ncbi:MAG TPA: ABC transporter permease [Actinomycetota bacterium]|nr:ABC transporter permease [Actinomycetota bacterium]
MATTDPTLVSGPVAHAPDEAVEGRTPWQLFWLRFRKDRAALIGLGVIGFLVVLALSAPLIAEHVVHHGPNDLHQREMTNEFGLPKGPNKQFWFGADSVGRDVFVRTLYGARTSMIVALLATSIAMVIGVILGIIAGYFRGWVDGLISRIIDIMLSMPLLLFAIGIAAACSVSAEGCMGGLIKPGLALVIFIIALFSWTYIARIIRGQTLTIREREFIDAARSIGSGHRRIMMRELLPNLLAPIIIYSTLVIPANILFESYLSYLGLGLPHTIPSWGAMIADAARIFRVAWWLMFFPGMFLFLTTLAFNLVGDGLRDALDPRTAI